MPESEYLIPNRAVSNTIIASAPINDNWDKIEEAINKNYDLSKQVTEKVDISVLGTANGVATLDNNIKLTLAQLPEQAKGHIYEAYSLYEQLSLTAYEGDLCVRKDINKTYCLSSGSPSSFSSWVEISSINSGGEIGGNPCFTNTISIDNWVEDTDGSYYLTVTSEEHGQGATKFLLVDIRREDGQDIICHTNVDDTGLVKISTDVPFDATIMISNLSGNIKNSQYIPYCVISGPRNADGNGDIFSRSLHTIILNTSTNIVIVDGFNIVRNISESNELEIPTSLPTGSYVLFSDSSNIVDTKLTSITYTSKEAYLGCLTSLPNTGIEGQRCYIEYDKSYEFTEGNWSAKAFTPLGEFTVKNESVASVITYKFKDNNIDVTKYSNVLDYLFGNRIEGLNIDINTQYLTVSSGKCLVDNKLINVSTMLKDYTKEWKQGNYNGAFIYSKINSYEVKNNEISYYTSVTGEQDYAPADASIYTDIELTDFYKYAEEDEFEYTGISYSIDDTTETGWGNVYLISGVNTYDIVLSYDSNFELPLGFFNKRNIGYFYKNEDTVMECRTLSGIIYLNEPISLNLTDDYTIESSVPTTSLIVKIDNPDLETVDIFNDNYLINSQSSTVFTVEVPPSCRFSTNNIELILIGYRKENIS